MSCFLQQLAAAKSLRGEVTIFDYLKVWSLCYDSILENPSNVMHETCVTI